MSKPELRRLLRSRFGGAKKRRAQSLRLCEQVLAHPLYKKAQIIGGYMPMTREADITPILMDALRNGKTLALPLCGDPPNMTFRRVECLDDLQPGAYGLLEPALEAEIIPLAEIDLLLVPLEGIDQDGFRLGKGGGYYDKALSGCYAVTLGCALSWQRVERVPREPWDVRLHGCADENGIHIFAEES